MENIKIDTKLKDICGVGIDEEVRPDVNLDGIVYFYFGKERYCATKFGLVFRSPENSPGLHIFIKDIEVRDWLLLQLKATELGCDSNSGKMTYEYKIKVRKGLCW